MRILIALVLIASMSSYAQVELSQEGEDFFFAEQLESKEMYDVAATQFLNYFKLYPTSLKAPEALFKAGRNFEKAGKLERAAEIYQKLLIRFPESSFIDQSQFNRANILRQLKQYSQAAVVFERIRLFVPESQLIPKAQLNAGQSFLMANETEKALDATYVLLENYPTHPLRLEARYLLARIRRKQHETKLALQELERITGENAQDQLIVNAKLLKADILRDNGRYSESNELLYELVYSDSKSDSIAIAGFKLGENYHRAGDYEKSINVLSHVLQQRPSKDVSDRIYRLMGDNEYALKNYQQANIHYNKVGIQSLDILFRKASTEEKLENWDIALNQFNKIVVLPDSIQHDPLLKFHSLLKAADIYCQKDQATRAIRTLREYMDSETFRPYRDQIIFKIGQIQESFVGDYVGARRNYSIITEMFPQSKVVDDAQFGIARTFKAEQNVQMALLEYERYLKLYPGADDYAAAREQLNYFQKFAPPKSIDADQAFSNVFEKGLSNNPRADVLYNWAVEQVETFHNYQRALSFFKKALSADDMENLDRQKIVFYLVYCHARLAEKNEIKANPVLAEQHYDTLQTSAALLENNFPRSPYTARVKKIVLEAELGKTSDPTKRINLLDRALNAISQHAVWDSSENVLRYRLARELYETGKDSIQPAYTDRALALLSQIEQQSNSEDLTASSLFLEAMIHKQRGNTDSTRVLLERFISNHSTMPQIVDALFVLAQLYESNGQLEKARDLYLDLAENYGYTNEGDFAHAKYCQVLFRLGEIEESSKCIDKKIQGFFSPDLALFLSHTVSDQDLWVYAQTQNDPMKKLASLKNYIELAQNEKRRAQALFQAGQVAAELGNLEAAVGHFEELIAKHPQDTLAQQARLTTADLFFELEKYEQAGRYYSEGKEYLTGELLAQAWAGEITCHYRTGNISRANRLLETFKDRFDDENKQALLYYERGMAFLKQKDFKEAEKSFKTAGKYDNVPNGGRGSLGLAKLYVTLNRTDDALKTLTEITTTYDDPDILAAAYVNLGDFYYENRQLENCINACRRVLDLQEQGPEHRSALRLLIGAYDDVRLWDRAISHAREYVALYPDAGNATIMRTRIGRFLYDMKEYDRAISYLKELKQRVDATTETEIQYWIAKSYADRGNLETAISEFLKVKYVCKPTKMPFGVTALYEAGQIYKKIGEFDKAKELFQVVVRERGAGDQIGNAAQKQIDEIDKEIAKDS